VVYFPYANEYLFEAGGGGAERAATLSSSTATPAEDREEEEKRGLLPSDTNKTRYFKIVHPKN
jgi:hypothetical protein